MSALYQAKLDRLRRFMQSQEIGTIVLSRTDNIAWLACGAQAQVPVLTDQAIASLVVTAERVTLVTNNIEAPRLADEEFADLPVAIEAVPWYEGGYDSRCERFAAEEGRIAADTAAVGREHVDLKPLRYALLPEEQDLYRALGRDVGEVIGAVARAARPGDTERLLAGRLAAALFDVGAWPVVLLVAADDRIVRYRHPLPTGRAVERAAMLVCSGRRNGLVAAVTRIVHFGPPAEDLVRRHRAVCQVDATLMAATVPGAAVAAVLAAGFEAYETSGFGDEWRHHHQGGAAGYQARDYRATPDSEEVVHAGQAFAWNPSIAGTKSEDTMLAHAHGPEVLTGSPDWPLVGCDVAGRHIARADILVS